MPSAIKVLIPSKWAAVVVWLACAAALPAADWPQWRGPALNGSSDETGLCREWGAQKNLLWKRALPGEAGSTPVIVGDRVFLTSMNRAAPVLHALCIRAGDGAILWDRPIPCAKAIKVPYGSLASPSPVADGERAVFLFGTGDLLAFDHHGNELWRRQLELEFGPLTIDFLYSASPLLHRNRLYISMLRDNVIRHPERHETATGEPDSFLLCLDSATGATLWKQDRPSEAAGQECRDSYATPLPLETDGGGSIVLIGAGYVTAHDWRTGAESLRLNYQPSNNYRQRVAPTPVTGGDRLFAVKPRYGPLFAIPKTLAGTHNAAAFAWEFAENTPDTPSPLYYRDRLYFIHDARGKLTCLDPATGKPVWVGELGGKGLYHASPTAADGRIYCIDLNGNAVVVQAGESFGILGRAAMGEGPCSSSIAIARGSLFIRTAQNLYCIKEAAAGGSK